MSWGSLQLLNEDVIACRKCPRLVDFRENLPKRASFQQEDYWRRPCPGYGDPSAKVLILGLAPSAHGGNRTGRIFTGDPSAEFLYNALHATGFSNKASSLHRHDGLKLNGCYVTAAVKCVPPKNAPTSQECHNCSPYWEAEVALLKNLRVILALGGLAFNRVLKFFGLSKVSFHHGAEVKLKKDLTLISSYHPSPQNTYTKKLTHQMLAELLIKIKNL